MDAPDASVWDEPALAQELAGIAPPEAMTYARWFAEARARTPAGLTWLVTVAVALLAGPWAVLGAFLGAQGGFGAVVLVAVLGPCAEEVLKVSAPWCIVERWPHLFRSRVQIALCACLSGLVFAAIENLLYLHVYVPDPPEWLIAWRWSACVALHTGCSLIAGLGVTRMWADATARQARPRASLALPALVAAVAVHGVYNAAALVWEVMR
jgi:RsiW-degrading membrane proteinase PrsW (M82 family)